MSACSFNWELFSKFIPLITGFIPVGITWFLYYQWHNQKGKEVIASECKDLWQKLDDLEKFYNTLDGLQELPKGLEYKDHIKDKDEIRKEFSFNVTEWKSFHSSKLQLIKDLTENNEKIVESIDKLINRLASFENKKIYQKLFNQEDMKEHFQKKEVVDEINGVKRSLIPFIKFTKSA